LLQITFRYIIAPNYFQILSTLLFLCMMSWSVHWCYSWSLWIHWLKTKSTRSPTHTQQHHCSKNDFEICLLIFAYVIYVFNDIRMTYMKGGQVCQINIQIQNPINTHEHHWPNHSYFQMHLLNLLKLLLCWTIWGVL
jgi:hypothetical protein